MSRVAIVLPLLAMTGTATAIVPKAAPTSCQRVYFGTQDPSRGISTALLDLRTGQLSPPQRAASLPRATWLLADRAGTMLYATSDPRDQPGTTPLVAAYAIDRASGDLRRIGAVEPGGQGPTHLSLDAKSRTLFVALYGSGQVAALPLDKGGQPSAPASVQTDTGTGPTPRQTGAHAHAAVLDPTGRFLLIPDLGADRVFVYRFDRRSRALSPAPVPFLQLPPGTGPRHLVFAPDGRTAYLVSELSAEVRTLRWDAAAGIITVLQTTPLAAAGLSGPKSASEIAISHDGAHLYVGDRTTNGIMVFAVDRRGGTISETQRISTGGKAPWSFALSADERWMVVANQASDSISILPRDRNTGRLAPAVAQASLSKPVAVAFAGGGTPC